MERRYISADEVRLDKQKDKTRLVGYAARFNQLSENLGGFREKIAPGAFTTTIKTSDVRALWNHDPNFVLGRKSSGTLELSEDDKGLKMDNIFPDTQWARDLLVSVERKDVKEMSFGFRTVNDAWEVVDGENIRTLLEVNLFDVSPVTFPAYPSTEVQARSLILLEKGIDIESIDKILVKVDRNLGSLLDSEINIIQSTIEKLNSLLPKKEPAKDDIRATKELIFNMRSKLFEMNRRVSL